MPFPVAGLYTPGSDLGAEMDAAVRNPCDLLGEAALKGVATSGTLSLEYTTRSLYGRYAPQNAAAVWIETLDGEYVATLELAASYRQPPAWQEHACIRRLGPDVVTSATRSRYDRPHSVTWRGFDTDEQLMPDGPYALYVEVIESDMEPSNLSTWQFNKGPQAYSRALPADPEGALVAATIAWQPE